MSLPAIRRTEWISLGVILAAYLAISLQIIREGATLGHDEAVYSLRARSFRDGSDPTSYWLAYRAPGLPFVLQVAWLVSPTEPFLRLVVVGFGALLVTTTWLIGRSLFGATAGLIAAGGMALSPVILMSGTQVWPDVPGAALGLLAVGIFLWAASGDRVAWWAVLAGPVAMAATYFRFGAPMPMAVGFTAVALLRWRSVLQSKVTTTATAAAVALGVGLVLFVPATTGATTSPYTAVSEQAFRYGWSAGFIDYFQQAGTLLGGIVGGLLVFGVVVAAILATQRTVERPAVIAVLCAAAGSFVWIALSLTGELRYLSPVYPWLWIAAGSGLGWIVARLSPSVTLAAAVIVVAIGGLGALGFLGERIDASARNVLNNAGQNVERASRIIAEENGDGPCSVLTAYVPNVGWYSGCFARGFNLNRVVVDDARFPADGPAYMLIGNLTKRQPEGELLEAYIAETEGLAFAIGDPQLGAGRYIEVYLIQP